MFHLFLIAFFLFGHAAVWVAIRNRTHAMPVSKRWKKWVDGPQMVGTVALPLWLAWRYARDPRGFVDPQTFWTLPTTIYAVCCGLYGIRVVVEWLRRLAVPRPLGLLLDNHTQQVDIEAELGTSVAQSLSARVFSAIPFNQPFRLSIHEKRLELARLPAALDGLSIVHLSDLHFCGNVALSYFESVTEKAIALDADLIAITGDILEREACFPWLAATLGRLRARHGVYFVLGNHDRLLHDVDSLRRQLADLGLVDLGRETKTISVRGQGILLAGNELPWFGPPPNLPSAEDHPSNLRILLSHSPDQIRWAQERKFDLVLAGHTHGGQIRFPLIGPVVCPSWYGVKYASGTFYEAPTAMHVSRGISGEDSLRINCPPELTKIVLKSPLDHI